MVTGDCEFRITISGSEIACTYQLPGSTDWLNIQEKLAPADHLDNIQLIETWLERWDWIAEADQQLLVRRTFEILGKNLWKMTLNNSAGQLLWNTIHTVRNSQALPRPTVHVRLTFTDDAEDLAKLPWEFLHPTEDNAGFLATQTKLTLGRSLAGKLFEVDFSSPDNKLRVLFLIGLPDEGTHDRERAAMRALVGDVRQMTTPERTQFVVQEGWQRSEIAQRLREFEEGEDGGSVDVVHLVALFRRNKYGENTLFLPGTSGKWGWNSASPVVRVLTEDHRPKLVILHLCDWHETDWNNAPEHFERLAPAFINRGVHAVLALHYPMRGADGGDFVRALYRRLADGERIGEAVQGTRNELQYNEDRHFGAPILFMQSKVDGSLVNVEPNVDVGEDVEQPVLRGGGRRPSPLQHKALPPDELKNDLLKIVDGSPSPTARARLRSWVAEHDWPTTTTRDENRLAAANAIKQQTRILDDEPEAVELLGAMLLHVQSSTERPSELR